MTNAAQEVGAAGLESLTKRLLRIFFATLFVCAGSLHFIKAEWFTQIVPPYLPWPLYLVYLSGVFELLGGVGLMVNRWRMYAVWGLIALLLAIFPANLHMAFNAKSWPFIPAWILYFRLPFQFVLIYGLYWCAVVVKSKASRG